MKFGIITHDIGNQPDYQVFVNALDDGNIELAIYSRSPIKDLSVLKSDGCNVEITELNESNDDDYVSAVEMSNMTEGAVSIKIDEHEVPQITWSTDAGVLSVTDFGGYLAHFRNGKWEKPIDSTHASLLDQTARLFGALLTEADPVKREALKSEIVKLQIVSVNDDDDDDDLADDKESFTSFIVDVLSGDDTTRH